MASPTVVMTPAVFVTTGRAAAATPAGMAASGRVSPLAAGEMLLPSTRMPSRSADGGAGS
jgi:hypothetical protein